MVELKYGAWHLHFNILSPDPLRTESPTESRSKQRPRELRPIGVRDQVESVVLEEEAVEDLVAVLLVHVTSFEFSRGVLDSQTQGLLSVLVIYDLPLGYN